MSNLNSFIEKSKSSDELIIKPFAVKLLGADLRIDCKKRRKTKTPYRRAVVHNQQDGLTVNWAKDYPGGVTINGKVNCPDSLKVKGYDLLKLVLEMRKKIQLLEGRLDGVEWD